jgi:hypothetical protein
MQAHLDAVHSALTSEGEVLVRSLLFALCDTCPRQLMRAAADCTRKLLTHPVLSTNARTWFAAAATSSQLPGVGQGTLAAEDTQRLCGIVLNGALLGPRLVALLVDFGLLARGQNTADVLLGYEM